jgi:hypothetical protein
MNDKQRIEKNNVGVGATMEDEFWEIFGVVED